MRSIFLVLAGGAAFAATLVVPSTAQSIWHATDLFAFDGSSGYSPSAGVITDRHGTIFGTTSIGGNGPCLGDAGCGTVFALSPPPLGSTAWIFDKLYDFQGGKDGSSPSAPLTLSPDGALYGYTTGGTPGTVFRLLPPAVAGDFWRFQILYVFTGATDGSLETVYSPLILRDGAIYGIASGGSSACGQFGCGSVFELKPPALADRAWTLQTLFGFRGGNTSGEPNWIVGSDCDDRLYVSTALGHGAVVEISPPDRPDEQTSSPQWTEHLVTRFEGGDDGHGPFDLLLGPDGTLFGLANTLRGGLVFRITRSTVASHEWTRTTIADVVDHGYGPASLSYGKAGSLIGAIEGDFDFFAGSIFQLTAPSTGTTWNYTELWSFNRGPDRNPLNVVTGLDGSLYGVLQGGDSTNGSLFELRRP